MLTELPAAIQSVTFNTATFGRSSATRTVQTTSTTFSPSDDYVAALSNSNAGDVLNAAANTDYDTKFLYTPARPFQLRKIAINIGMCMNVSANGGASTVTFKSVQVIINKLRGNQNVEIYNQTKATGITATTGTATQIYVFNDAAQVQAALTDIQPGDVITAEVITVSTDSGAATRQMGMLPWFPYYASTNNKSLSQSAILLQGELV